MGKCQQIVTGWGQYFQNLYSDTVREYFDAQFKSQVDHQMQDILMSCLSLVQILIPIVVSEIKKAAKLLKTKKACGNDGVYNEHSINGGNGLLQQLSLLYSDMFTHGYIPDTLKALS